MTWETEARSLFTDLMRSGPPAALAESASQAVKRCAERLARARQSPIVEISDVAAGCLRVAPPAFKPSVLANLGRRGIALPGGATPGDYA
jgi:hypothetical protein